MRVGAMHFNTLLFAALVGGGQVLAQNAVDQKVNPDQRFP